MTVLFTSILEAVYSVPHDQLFGSTIGTNAFGMLAKTEAFFLKNKPWTNPSSEYFPNDLLFTLEPSLQQQMVSQFKTQASGFIMFGFIRLCFLKRWVENIDLNTLGKLHRRYQEDMLQNIQVLAQNDDDGKPEFWSME